MKKTLLGLSALFLLAITIQSCGDDIQETFKDYTEEEYAIITKRLNLPLEVYDYSADFDQEFFVNHVGEKDIRSRRGNHKATLGRVLFYDTKLSLNESVSCASCHKQELAFADDLAFSEGFDGEITTRNSLPLGNTIGFETAYGSGGSRAQFAWDEANADISSQSRAAILNAIEMGLDMPTLVDRIEKDEAYSILFKKTYGDENIMEHRILEALEEFVNSIVSAESKFDHESMKANGDIFSDFKGFTAEENVGKQLYLNKCASCHSFDHMFTAKAVANNGLDKIYEDKGVGSRTNSVNDYGVFKVPFLRNIELTAPYMHDGRFKTIREVIDHYSEGIADHPNLDFELRNGSTPVKMDFSEGEKQALEAYLLTLTDEELLADVRFSDPFKK
ncbi:MAG: cytochrome c peroxidase [Bacteroidota bacterium]